MALPADILTPHAAGRLKDGDTVFVLKVPENASFRYEKWIFRVRASDKRPILVLQIAPDNAGAPGAYGQEVIKEAEYWGNYSTWANVGFSAVTKKIVDSGILVKGAELTGLYAPNNRFPTNATLEDTDYVIDADGIVTKSPKAATSEDVQKQTDQQTALLNQLVSNVTGANTTGATGTPTTTQKIVRIVLIVAAVALAAFGISKLIKRKKK